MNIHTHKAHPWHGISAGADAPRVVHAFIEIVPTDSMKYEVDKESGYLRIDRPQRFSNLCPTLYGFVPHTYCGKRVGERASARVNRPGIIGDGDPLDICVLSERPILHGDILLQAVPIGGLRMIDGGEADDKIIAVLKGDLLYGEWTMLEDCPTSLVDRLRHYFLTYKGIPGGAPPKVEIAEVYGVEEAQRVISLSLEDYDDLVRETKTNGKPTTP